MPTGWLVAGSAPAVYAIAVNAASPVRTSKSASISAKPGASSGFATLMQMIAAERYRGHRVKLSTYLQTLNAGRAQLWMRVDGPAHRVLSFDNKGSHPIIGTQGLKR